MADRQYVYIDMVDTAILCGLDIKPSRVPFRQVLNCHFDRSGTAVLTGLDVRFRQVLNGGFGRS